ncbi:Ig domain protein, group 2 domain protein [Psychromonas sp. CNPT3]|uniref:Ig-like domain-containing protein n=1 Tax=Psychromonas sp. CNPT3 TaxID=314282 RepID=UPI00006E3C0C|nr:Ig-like domain-containing protein [Psychromonas sp. CNPT3]AGH81349.1 Ig domain protein, group 2 domain protein [Psychromonas sp. CNPT3]
MINYLKYALFFFATLMLTACNNEGEGLVEGPELGELVSDLQVTPARASVIVGLSQQYKATAIMFDDSTMNITTHDALEWSSSDTSIATVNADTGTVTAVKSGTVDIMVSGTTAAEKPFTKKVELTVISASVINLQVTPAVASIPAGLSQHYMAQATLTNHLVFDVTTDPALSWSSDNTSVATVDTNTGIVTGLTAGTANITASGTANGDFFTQTVKMKVTGALVTSLQVTPAIASLAVGISRPYTALVTLSDDSVFDVTTDPALSWHSDNPSIASIDTNTGIATGLIKGDVNITASGTANGHYFTEHVTLTVTDAIVTSLHVTPAIATIIEGLSQQFEAQATLSDGSVIDVTTGSSISWSSDNTSVATIDAETGKATGLVPGTVTITAAGSNDGHHYSNGVTLTVTEATVDGFMIDPGELSVARGLTTQFSAYVALSNGLYVDVTTDPSVSWVSDDTNKATIESDTGIVTGVNETSGVMISVLLSRKGKMLNADAMLSITKEVMVGIEVTSVSKNELTVGSRRQFTAKAIFSDGTRTDLMSQEALIWQTTDSVIASMTDETEVPYYKAVAVSHSVGHVGVFASYAGFTSNKVELAIIPVQSRACSIPSITKNGLIYDCPPTKEQADLLDANYTISRVETDGKMSPVGMEGVAFTLFQAMDFCGSQGKRLPSLDELSILYKATKHNNTDASLYLNYGWPLKHENYWTDNFGIGVNMATWPDSNGIEYAEEAYLYTVCVKTAT